MKKKKKIFCSPTQNIFQLKPSHFVDKLWLIAGSGSNKKKKNYVKLSMHFVLVSRNMCLRLAPIYFGV